MIASFEKYLKVFTQLRIDRAHGIAPNKPILLLSVLQSVLHGQITENRIYITAELVSLFRSIPSHKKSAPKFGTLFL